MPDKFMVKLLKKVYAMKLFILGFFLSVILPSTALANYCRATTDTPQARNECIRKHYNNGISTYGDWIVYDPADPGYTYGLEAKNFAFSYSGPNLEETTFRGNLKLNCYDDRTAFATIGAGTKLKKGSHVHYRFDDDEYIKIGGYTALKTKRFESGYVISYDKDFIRNLFERSTLELLFTSKDEGNVKQVFTLKGDRDIRTKLSCLSEEALLGYF